MTSSSDSVSPESESGWTKFAFASLGFAFNTVFIGLRLITSGSSGSIFISSFLMTKSMISSDDSESEFYMICFPAVKKAFTLDRPFHISANDVLLLSAPFFPLF